MKQELKITLQAYLDGELPPGEVSGVKELLAQDDEARALCVELDNTRKALTGFEAEIKLPEPREFYWSKIERDIRRLEKSESVKRTGSLFAGWRRALVPAMVFVVAATAVILVAPQFGSFGQVRPAETETALGAADGFTYRDYASGSTLVWLSYPAENEFAEFGSGDTIQ